MRFCGGPSTHMIARDPGFRKCNAADRCKQKGHGVPLLFPSTYDASCPDHTDHPVETLRINTPCCGLAIRRGARRYSGEVGPQELVNNTTVDWRLDCPR